MAKKIPSKANDQIVYAEPTYQPITETIEKNYMPYAMSVIISRAIPEIDGFKPAHRKLLYTMYKMGLMSGPRTKSANVVGATMKLNPHGDAAIYDTMVRLTRDNEALLHPLIDSKGSFGKQYSSTDMKCAAARYTEVRLDPFCAEIFRGIDKDAVDMTDNYDGTMKEPVLLPTTFPNILIMPTAGIAVGMASSICSFNLAEICDGTIALLKNPKTSVEKLMEIIKAPDFPGGGEIIYNAEAMREVFTTGQGSVRIRSRYSYDKHANCIDILQIPYSTTIEVILNKIADLYKAGKLKEITDFRDEIDVSGFKLTIDLRRGVDPDKLMKKLFKLTTLEDSFKCNFNVLIDSVPRVMGVPEILNEWIRFRLGCVRRELTFNLKKKEDKLHLLLGLGKILLDIDKAIKIVRGTERDADVVPNLMKGFSIDEIQAEYIAEIKLRYLNREYILERIQEIDDLEKEIDGIKAILGDELKQKALIAKQLAEIKSKYGQPRRSLIVHESETDSCEPEETVENYNVRLYLTKEGYFKKITLLSLRGNDEQKLKDGDSITEVIDTENAAELLFITDKCRMYRAAVADFDNVKASQMGEFVPVKLGFEPGEKPILMKLFNGFNEGENFVYIFENGKGVKIPSTAYVTKAPRRKLVGSYSDTSPIVAAFAENEKDPFDILLVNDAGRAAIIKSSLIPVKATRTSGGVQLFNLKKDQKLTFASADIDSMLENSKGLKKLKIPATGSPLSDSDAKKFN